MPKLVSSFSIVPNYKILSFLLLKVNDPKEKRKKKDYCITL